MPWVARMCAAHAALPSGVVMDEQSQPLLHQAGMIYIVARQKRRYRVVEELAQRRRVSSGRTGWSRRFIGWRGGTHLPQSRGAARILDGGFLRMC